jgi:hypothetical protein
MSCSGQSRISFMVDYRTVLLFFFPSTFALEEGRTLIIFLIQDDFINMPSQHAASSASCTVVPWWSFQGKEAGARRQHLHSAVPSHQSFSAELCAGPLSNAKCAASLHQLARFSVAASYLWQSTLRLDPSIIFLYDHVKVAWWNHFYHTKNLNPVFFAFYASTYAYFDTRCFISLNILLFY